MLSKLVSVQPLGKPCGKLFYIDYRYGLISKELMDKAISNIKILRREERLEYILSESK